MGMSTGLREGFVPEQPRTPVTTTDTTLGAWAWAELRPVLDTADELRSAPPVAVARIADRLNLEPRVLFSTPSA